MHTFKFPLAINAAASKVKLQRWIADLIKGRAGGNSCIVKKADGRIVPELYHHIMGSEMDEIESCSSLNNGAMDTSV